MTSGASRTGKSKSASPFPPNPLEWTNERNAMKVRERLRLDSPEPLSPLSAFRLLLPHVAVRAHGDIPCAQKYIERLRGSFGGTWSAITFPAGSNNDFVVIYND